MFLKAIAEILDVKEKELRPKLIAPKTQEAGWYEAIVVKKPFTKPSKIEIENMLLDLAEFDDAIKEIERDENMAMTTDNKIWSNPAIFKRSLSVKNMIRVRDIKNKTKTLIDKKDAKEIVSKGMDKFRKRIRFADEMTALMGYLNSSKVLSGQQYIDQATILNPIRQALVVGSTTYGRMLVNALTPDEVIITTADKTAILLEMDNFLAGE